MKISIVTSLYYSEGFIEEFYERSVASVKKITDDYEFIFVDDGSPDQSGQKVISLQERDQRIVLIELSKNFGHHKALFTGLKHATGDYIFLIDVDLEEDPELLSVFWEALQAEKDADVIYGTQAKRKGAYFEKASGRFYYRLISLLSKTNYPADSLTARLMSHRYVDGLKQLEEKEADLWGLFILTGFKQKGVMVTKKYKGKSTYNLRRKISMAVDTFTTLTHRPLYLIGLIGMIITIISGGLLLYHVIRKLLNEDYSQLQLILSTAWFIGGIILLALGTVSVYLSKMFLEVKNRPIVIKKIHRK